MWILEFMNPADGSITDCAATGFLYLHLISGGTVCHANAARNYYRIHSDSTSLGIQQKPEYFREHEKGGHCGSPTLQA